MKAVREALDVNKFYGEQSSYALAMYQCKVSHSYCKLALC